MKTVQWPDLGASEPPLRGLRAEGTVKVMGQGEPIKVSGEKEAGISQPSRWGSCQEEGGLIGGPARGQEGEAGGESETGFIPGGPWRH